MAMAVAAAAATASGCDALFGVTPGGRDAGDADAWTGVAVDAGVDAVQPDGPPEDLDADGVANAVDNCPGHGNSEQWNEDGDTTGDACDACPHQFDDGDDFDDDGVGTGCDPDDMTSGHRWALFDGFEGELGLTTCDGAPLAGWWCALNGSGGVPTSAGGTMTLPWSAGVTSMSVLHAIARSASIRLVAAIDAGVYDMAASRVTLRVVAQLQTSAGPWVVNCGLLRDNNGAVTLRVAHGALGSGTVTASDMGVVVDPFAPHTITLDVSTTSATCAFAGVDAVTIGLPANVTEIGPAVGLGPVGVELRVPYFGVITRT